MRPKGYQPKYLFQSVCWCYRHVIPWKWATFELFRPNFSCSRVLLGFFCLLVSFLCSWKYIDALFTWLVQFNLHIYSVLGRLFLIHLILRVCFVNFFFAATIVELVLVLFIIINQKLFLSVDIFQSYLKVFGEVL